MTIQIITIARYAESEYIRRKFQKYVQYAILLYMTIEITHIVQNVDIGNIYNIATNRQYSSVGFLMPKNIQNKWKGDSDERNSIQMQPLSQAD